MLRRALSLRLCHTHARKISGIRLVRKPVIFQPDLNAGRISHARFFHFSPLLCTGQPADMFWTMEQDNQEALTEDDVLQAQASGLELMVQGKDKEAAVIFDQLLVKHPNDINLLYKQSVCICTIPGRWPEALKNITKAVSYVPNQLDAHVWDAKGLVLIVGKKYDEAVAALNRSIQINDTLPQAHWNLALALCGLRQYYPALLEFDAAIELLGPDHDADIDYTKGLALYWLDRYDEAFEWLNSANVDNHPLRADYYLGLRAFRAGNYSDALTHFEHAPMGWLFNGDVSDLWSWRGECYEALGQHDKALECYETALKQNPKDALSLHGKGQMLLKQAKTNEARDAFNAAYAIDEFYYKSDYMRVKTPPKL